MAFGQINERGGGNRFPRPGAVTPPIPSAPVIPAPPATPAGTLKPNVAQEPRLGGKPNAGKPKPNRPPVAPGAPTAAVPRGQQAPNPQVDKLPPQFANMVKGGMSEAQARQRWARSLQNRGKTGPGIPGGGGATTPKPAVPTPTTTPGGPATGNPTGSAPASPFVPSPQPAPGTPIFSSSMPPLGYNSPAGQGGPPSGYPGGPGSPGSPIVPGGQDFRDPMSSFLSAVPLMNINASKKIDDAMSQAGFSGNRWSTSAMNTAADIGSQNALAQSAMFTDMLQKYANQQEDRALQASGMGMGLGGMLDQQAQDRVKLPFQLGAYEQGRADDLSRQYYDDFERNKTGWLPMFLQAASGQSGGSAGTLMPVPGEPAKPGGADYLALLAQLFG